MKNKLLRVIAKTVKKTAQLGAGKRCLSDWHQPEVPHPLKHKNLKQKSFISE